MKHEAYELKQMQSLPLKYKILMSQQRIQDWYEYWNGNVYVSRSGGKDSDVLGHIVKEMYPDVPQVFVDTGLEYDSVRLHGEEIADIILRPKMSFVQVITQYGYPVISKEISLKVNRIQRNPNSAYKKFFDGSEKGKSIFDHSSYNWLLKAPFRISDKCCDVMKKTPIKTYEKESENKPFIGTLADESRLRKTKWLQYGCNAFDKKNPSSQPLSFWNGQDILQYINQKNIKMAEVYGDLIYKDEDDMPYSNDLFTSLMTLELTGEKRTGCIFCLFGIRQDTDRFLRLKETEPKKYDYVMRGGKFDEQGMWIPHQGLGYKFVIDWLNEHGNLNIKY